MILSAVLIVCVGLSIWLMMPGEDASAAEIWLDGEIYKTVSLSRNQEFVVQSDHGSNTVTVRNGKIAVTAADCPDHYCMDRGYCAGALLHGPGLLRRRNADRVLAQPAGDQVHWGAGDRRCSGLKNNFEKREKTS